MIQPFIRSVALIGEIAVMSFAGNISHAVRKGPLLEKGGGLRGGTYKEDISPVEITAELISAATTTERATAKICSERIGVADSLLYSRFDFVELSDGGFALLEAELFEPSLFISTSPGAARRFANAVSRRIA